MPGTDIIVIGASAGGIEVLKTLASELPRDFQAAIFVVVHISPNGPGLLPEDGGTRTTGDCTWRVARGGAWNYSPNYLRSAFRYWNLPHNRSGVQGLRVVRTL